MLTVTHQNSQSLNELDAGDLLQKLGTHGALLLRGFDTELAGFERFSRRLCGRFHVVGKRRPLREGGSDGFTSETPTRNYRLLSHAEGSYRPWPPPPQVCFFNCVRPPGSPGGETTLVDGVEFLSRMTPDLRRPFEHLGLQFEALWDANRWRTEFQVASESELARRCRHRKDIEWTRDGDDLRVRCRVPAVRNSLAGEPAFANGLLAHLPSIEHPALQDQKVFSKPNNVVRYGDGQAIPAAVITNLIDLELDIARAHRWQTNDLLILDNQRVMHGRQMTEGDCDRVIRSRFGFL
jgi:alpha-ketoglutarate-dependent taurine dioxygenase